MKEVDPWGIIEKLRLQHKAEIHDQWMPLVAEYREQVDALQSRLESLEKTKESLCKALDDAGDSLIEAGAKIESLEKDAARYRWLRRCKGQEHDPLFTVHHELDGTLWSGDLDYAIDTAMQANKGE